MVFFAKRTPTPANPVVRAAAGRGVLAAGGGAATAGAARGGGDPSPMSGIGWWKMDQSRFGIPFLGR